MKKILPILLIPFILVFLCVGNVTAFDWSLGHYVEEDYVRDSDGYVGPGWGGQEYDVERLGMYEDTGVVNFGLKTGFNLNTGFVSPNHAGDFALDTTGDGSFDHAIQLSFDGLGGLTSGIYSGSGDWWEDPVHYNTDPFASGTYPWKMDNTKGWTKVADLTNLTVYTGSGNEADSWFLEGSFDLDKIGSSLDGMTISWTMECGNDVLQYPATVPEPATMLLLGTGLIGLAGLGRKRYLK